MYIQTFTIHKFVFRNKQFLFIFILLRILFLVFLFLSKLFVLFYCNWKKLVIQSLFACWWVWFIITILETLWFSRLLLFRRLFRIPLVFLSDKPLWKRTSSLWFNKFIRFHWILLIIFVRFIRISLILGENGKFFLLIFFRLNTILLIIIF